MSDSTRFPRVPLAAGLLTGAMAAWYGFVGMEPSGGVSLGFSLLPFAAVAVWFDTDARRRGRRAVTHDYGLLAWIVWPVYVPWYAVQTRGRSRGWRLTLALFALLFAPALGMLVGFGVWRLLGR